MPRNTSWKLALRCVGFGVPCPTIGAPCPEVLRTLCTNDWAEEKQKMSIAKYMAEFHTGTKSAIGADLDAKTFLWQLVRKLTE